jgi:hypothetical protein
MKEDLHFKAFGVEIRAIGRLAIGAATLLMALLILSAGGARLF